jgi:acyl carrier protein
MNTATDRKPTVRPPILQEESHMNDDLLATFTDLLTTDFGVPAAEVSPDATFEALGLDSLDIVELTLALEDRTGVKLGDEDLEHVRTVQDAIDKVRERQA